MKTFKEFSEEYVEEGAARKVSNAYRGNRARANQKVADKRRYKAGKKTAKHAKKAGKQLKKLKGVRGNSASKARTQIRKQRDSKISRATNKGERKSKGFQKRADKHRSKIK